MSSSWLAGKSVLLTGAAGTVGGGLLKVILEEKPRVVRLLDSYEHGLFLLQQAHSGVSELRFLLGDIRDESRLRRAMRGIDVVIHAAALKHVEIGEYNPFEIVQTNLVGLQNVIQAALEDEVERVIFTSSDKAVNPANAMGASKLMGERLMSAANEITGGARTRFSSVRFGNILGSNGSVAGIFRAQIEQGGPLTLTDRRMSRFVMGLEHSVRLVLRAAEVAVGGEVFVLKMPVLRIADLADAMIRRFAPQFGRAPESITVREIGMKPGEKLYEELLAESELTLSYEDDELIVFLGEKAANFASPERSYLKSMRPVAAAYNSERINPMTPAQIDTFLEEIGVALPADRGANLVKSLVTGGAGFIGRWVVKRLLEAGHEVLALDDLSNGRAENLSEFNGRPGYLGLLVGDLKDRATVARIFKETTWDRVLHLGASIHVQRSIDEPEVTFRNDVEGTFSILEACREQYFQLNGLSTGDRRFHLGEVVTRLVDRRPRIVVMSTCMVYLLASGETGIAEDHPMRPASPYAASKIAADNLALSYAHAYRLPVTVARPFNTFGPFQKSSSEGGVVSVFLKRDISGEPLLIKGDGTQTRDLLFVEDCADFVFRAAEAPQAEGEIINAGTGHDVSINQLAQLAATNANRIEHVPHDHPQAEIPRLLCDAAKAERLLGWKSETSLQDGLERTRSWLRENRWSW